MTGLLPGAASIATIAEVREIARDVVLGELFRFLTWHIGIVMTGAGLTAGLVWFVIKRALNGSIAGIQARVDTHQAEIDRLRQAKHEQANHLMELRGQVRALREEI